MATLEIKYAIGDVVYSAGTRYVEKTEVCPDCIGTKKWIVKFPSGEEKECPCQTCKGAWNESLGYLKYSEYAPSVVTLTIGQVGFEDGRGRYMCEETGIGSGSVYYDENLFSTSEEAQTASKVRYEDQMKRIAQSNFKKRGEFAERLELFGFIRAEALRKERDMRSWLKLIDNN